MSTFATSEQVDTDLSPDELAFYGVGTGDAPQGMDPDALADVPPAQEPTSDNPTQEEEAGDDSLRFFGIDDESPKPPPETEATSPVDEQVDESDEDDVLYVDEEGHPVDPKTGELLKDEPNPYYVGEGMEYDSLDTLKRSHRDKETYITKLKTQLESASKSLQAKEEEVASVMAEFEAMRGAYFKGMSEDEHLERIAYTQLPDELRNVSSDLPEREDFLPDKQTFVDNYLREALGGKSKSDFEDENVYQMQVKEAKRKADKAFEDEVAAAEGRYKDAMLDSVRKQSKREAELAKITERLKAERERTKQEILERQEREEALAMQALESIKQFAKTQPLNFSDSELNHKGEELLREVGFMDAKGGVTEKFVAFEAQYGSVARNLLFEGIRQQVLQSRPSPKGKRRVVVVKPRTHGSPPPAPTTHHEDRKVTAEEQFKELDGFA